MLGAGNHGLEDNYSNSLQHAVVGVPSHYGNDCKLVVLTSHEIVMQWVLALMVRPSKWRLVKLLVLLRVSNKLVIFQSSRLQSNYRLLHLRTFLLNKLVEYVNTPTQNSSAGQIPADSLCLHLE
jgi:uncharacterized membrane protein